MTHAPGSELIGCKAKLLQARHLTTVAPRGERVQVLLSNASTWQKFCRQNTEMIVTKVGRRMFPCLNLDISGLEPTRRYELFVTLLLADQHTLKYQRGVWVPNGQAECYPPPGCAAGLAYVHPDSPATGRQWMKQEVTFMKLKLTNKLEGFEDPDRNGTMIFAYSMHKYLPVVHINEVLEPKPEQQQQQRSFYTSLVFPGTEFITVTAYQNPELTDLKIQFNPYAKGIRNQTDKSATGIAEASPSASPFVPDYRPRLPLKEELLSDYSQSVCSSSTPDAGRQLHPHSEDAHVQFGVYQQSQSLYGHWDSTTRESRRVQPYHVRRPESPMQPHTYCHYMHPAAAAYYQPGYFYLQQQQQQQQQQLEQQQQQQQQVEASQLTYRWPDRRDFESATPPSEQQEPPQQQQQQQQQQQLLHHQLLAASCQSATPQSSSITSSSRVTDSSPSTISFNSPDL